ncbi:TIR domain-containing protein [Nocardia asteroides]|uniref:TIR domain-containing protein n=1 Tax=Nocardia asteroides TaxID=1824 RepID=UPI003655D561
MADVAISYAHADTAFAERVQAAVEADGLTVWRDESVNLPPGQRHWEVIAAEFAGADVVLVIDTPQWHASGYCRQEYDFLRERGKWVVHVDPADAATYTAFAPELRANRASIRVHTRLVQAALASERDTRHSWAERWLNRSHAHDARQVLEFTEPQQVSVPGELAEFARKVVERDQTVRRNLVRAGVLVTAVLAVFAVAGLGAWILAEIGRNAAEHNADKSMALKLASESSTEPNTLRAVELATRADALQPSQATAEALAQARARDARMRVVDIEKQPYKGAAWAPGGRTLVAYTNSEIHWLDGETGRIQAKRDTAAGIVIGTVVVAADGGTVAFVADDVLWLISRDASQEPRLITPNVISVATGDGTDLWFGTSLHGIGGITRSSFSAASPKDPRVFEGTPALAITVDHARGLVDMVGLDGKAHLLRIDQDRLSEYGSFDITTVDPHSGRFGAAVTRCGDNLFGILYGGPGIHYTMGFRAKSFSSVQGVVEVGERSNGKSAPVCQPDGSAVRGNFGGGTKPDSVRPTGSRPQIPDGSDVYTLAADPGGTRLAVLTWVGRLYLLGHEHTSSWPVENAVTLLPLARDLAIRQDGAIVDAGTGAEVGRVSSAQVFSSTLSVLDGVAYVLTGDGITAIRADGAAEVVLPVDPATLTDLRAGADGKHLVLAHEQAVTLFEVGTRSVRRISLDGGTDADRVLDADVVPSGDTVVFATEQGRVGSVTVDAPGAPRFYEHALPVGTQTRIAVASGGRILVAGQDGVLRVLDPDLSLVDEAFVHGPAGRMTMAGNYALLAFGDSAQVYDVATLRLIDTIDGPLDPETLRLDLGRGVLRGLMSNGFAMAEIGDLATMRRVEIPVPGVR